MHHISAKYLLLVIFITSVLSAAAQSSNLDRQSSTRENSPYSRYGVGEMRNAANISLRGMGSVTSAYSSGTNVNAENPASYAGLRLTTYEASIEANTKTVVSGVDKYKTGNGTLNYMNIGIPLGKYAGMALGYRPISRTFYLLNDTSLVDSFGKAIKSYSGEGTLSQGYIGFAGNYKGISLGFNFGYVFGTTEIINSMEPLDITSKVISSRFYRKTRIGGIYWDAGAMYEHSITKKLGLRGGATLHISQGLKATRDEYWISYKFQTDTPYQNVGNVSKVTIPTRYSAGIQLVSTDHWTVGVDYSAAQWGQFRSYGLTDSFAQSNYRIAVGGEFCPNPDAKTQYLSKVTYRLGFYYGTDPVMLRNTQLNYYAVTGGFSLPFKKNIARLHTSIEIGRRGTTANGLFKENFVRVGLGLSLNDKWFIKRKYD
ncbi:MAG: hypothetical protein JST82_13620 [Bacteroidetes bacterium]|nr:hypothetical protein [Bacteroidota bacterium]